MTCNLEKIALWAKNDADAIAMIICACSNLSNENGLILQGHKAINEAAINILKYFEISNKTPLNTKVSCAIDEL